MTDEKSKWNGRKEKFSLERDLIHDERHVLPIESDLDCATGNMNGTLL